MSVIGLPARREVFSSDSSPTELQNLNEELLNWTHEASGSKETETRQVAAERILVSYEARKFSPQKRTLDLSDLGLTSLPKRALGCLSELQWLNLNQNRLTDLTGVAWPPTLADLHLENNQLTSLFTVVFPESLRSLRLKRNRMEGLCDLWPARLVYLDLSHNCLSDRVSSWPPHVELLELSYNQFT